MPQGFYLVFHAAYSLLFYNFYCLFFLAKTKFIETEFWGGEAGGREPVLTWVGTLGELGAEFSHVGTFSEDETAVSKCNLAVRMRAGPF